MDETFQNNNFSEQISFTVSSSKKAASKNKTEKELNDEISESNSELSESILGFSRNIENNLYEANKYVVVGLDNHNSVSAVDNSSQIPDEQSISEKQVVSYIQTERMSEIIFNIEKFLRSNLDFWMSVNENLGALNESAISLKNKK